MFETGPSSVLFFYTVTVEGMPAICIDTRHAKAALDMAANKTDANDADGLAHLAEVGFYKAVRIKCLPSKLELPETQPIIWTLVFSKVQGRDEQLSGTLKIRCGASFNTEPF